MEFRSNFYLMLVFVETFCSLKHSNFDSSSHLSHSSVAIAKPEQAVAYAENFHGGFHSVACGGHLYLVCAVRDVTF